MMTEKMQSLALQITHPISKIIKVGVSIEMLHLYPDLKIAFWIWRDQWIFYRKNNDFYFVLGTRPVKIKYITKYNKLKNKY